MGPVASLAGRLRECWTGSGDDRGIDLPAVCTAFAGPYVCARPIISAGVRLAACVGGMPLTGSRVFWLPGAPFRQLPERDSLRNDRPKPRCPSIAAATGRL